jgi:hypothetical protein
MPDSPGHGLGCRLRHQSGGGVGILTRVTDGCWAMQANEHASLAAGPREKAAAADLEIGSRFAAGSRLAMNRVTTRRPDWTLPDRPATIPLRHCLAGWPEGRLNTDHRRSTWTVLHDHQLVDQCSSPLRRRRGPGSGSAPGGLGCAMEGAKPGSVGPGWGCRQQGPCGTGQSCASGTLGLGRLGARAPLGCALVAGPRPFFCGAL